MKTMEGRQQLVLQKLLISVFITVSQLSIGVFSQGSLVNIPVPPPAVGPHSVAFDNYGRGPYTCISDGRILRYVPSRRTFVDFAYTSHNRTRALCDGVNTTNYLATCGRPLGLDFYHPTGELFITDASLGLFKVGPDGGRAKLLVAGANGTRFRFCVGLDVHQQTGLVYFTDASSSGGVDQIQYIVEIADATGRVMVYNQKKNKVSILVSGLSGAASVAVSKDGYYLMLAEFIGNRIRRYWLKGPRARTLEILMNTTGTPDNIQRTDEGDFWVAITSPTGQPQGIRIDGNATILETITFSPQFEPTFLAEVKPYGGSLYLGTLGGRNLGVYTPGSSWSSM